MNRKESAPTLPTGAEKLTSMERYHYLSDVPETPNNVFCRLDFDGLLNLDLFVDAATKVYARHPLIRCTLDSEQKNWVQHDDLHGIVIHPAELPAKISAIDLTREPGVKVHIGTGPNGTQILFQGHHATADGLACLDMIREAFLVYQNQLDNKPPLAGLSKLNYGLLAERNKLGLLSTKYLKHLYKQPIAVMGAAKFLTRRFEQFKPQNQPQHSFPAVRGIDISHTTFENLNEWASKTGLLKNSLLLGGFFLVVREFLSQQREAINQDLSSGLRVIVPMTMRDRKHFRMPGANRSTIVQVDRSLAEMADESTFFYYLDREIRIMRGWRFDLLFPMIVRTMSISNRWLQRSATNPKSRATAVFTNLGEPWRWARKRHCVDALGRPKIGDAVVTTCEVIGPIRSGTPVNLTVQEFGEGLRLSLHYDDRILLKDEVDELLCAYRDWLDHRCKQGC